ncbi:MAG: phosphoglycerate kinase [candidate division Zixibacteria bacterium]|nr:phosphoglycerate kinase [candidate division Zixibacteria bacterium]
MAFNKLTIDDIELKGKRALIRVDFNVPLNADGEVADDTRLRATLPTVKKVLDSGGKAVLMSHLGRPKGQKKPEFSLRPVAQSFGKLLGKNVSFVEDCIGEEAQKAANSLSNGECLLLENLRFYPGETDNDSGFAGSLAKLGDIYVNDAFGSAHRAHASTAGVPSIIKPAVAGYLMMKELDYLGNAIADPKKPFVAILGGAKISGKIDVIKSLMPKVDRILVGGGMTYTFFKALGYKIGNSLLEEDRIEMAASLIELAKTSECELILPVDSVIAKDINAGNDEVKTAPDKEIPDGWLGVDIGPDTLRLFKDKLSDAKTVVWNGPMGIFEKEPFARGTFELASELANISDKGAVTIIGGGDSASAVKKAGVADRVTHISTGGGASLEFLEGKELPGVVALTDKQLEYEVDAR